MHDEIGFERELPRSARSAQPQRIAGTFNSPRAKIEIEVDSLFAQPRHGHRDEVRVESLERTRSSMNDGDLRTRNGGQVGELHGDVSATDKNDAWRQCLQLQELLADGDEILSRNPQRGRFRAGSDGDVSGLEKLAGHFERIWSCEAGRAVECGDAFFAETIFFRLRDGVRKRALESH